MAEGYLLCVVVAIGLLILSRVDFWYAQRANVRRMEDAYQQVAEFMKATRDVQVDYRQEARDLVAHYRGVNERLLTHLSEAFDRSMSDGVDAFARVSLARRGQAITEKAAEAAVERASREPEEKLDEDSPREALAPANFVSGVDEQDEKFPEKHSPFIKRMG